MACNNFLFGMELCTTLDEAVISPVAASQQQTRDNFILVSHVLCEIRIDVNHLGSYWIPFDSFIC